MAATNNWGTGDEIYMEDRSPILALPLHHSQNSFRHTEVLILDHSKPLDLLVNQYKAIAIDLATFPSSCTHRRCIIIA